MSRNYSEQEENRIKPHMLRWPDSEKVDMTKRTFCFKKGSRLSTQTVYSDCFSQRVRLNRWSLLEH
jgi:hypothetical protein